MKYIQEILSSIINLFAVPEQHDPEEMALRSWREIGLAVIVVFFIVGMNVIAN